MHDERSQLQQTAFTTNRTNLDELVLDFGFESARCAKRLRVRALQRRFRTRNERPKLLDDFGFKSAHCVLHVIHAADGCLTILVSVFLVPEGRLIIAQRFIAGLSVRDSTKSRRDD